MRLSIRHTTHYRFETAVAYGLQQLRKTPKSTHQQNVQIWDTIVENGQKELSYNDHHHNVVELISFDRAVTELTITSMGEVEVSETNGVIGRHIGPAPLWLYCNATPRTKAGKGIRSILRKIKAEDDLERLHQLMAVIRKRITYEIGASDPDWTAEDAIAAGRGVCQDHTHVFLTAARELGYPARYVSGYLMLNETVQQDAMHAWAEVHVDTIGWVGFDVANGISPDVRYVRVATGLDYAEAAPITGSRIGGAGETLRVQIEVAQQ